MFYPIAISTGDDKHAWGVEVPDIPGCFSAGKDLENAVTMAREAIEGHFEILAEIGSPIPPAKTVTGYEKDPQYAGCTWEVVEINLTKYLAKSSGIDA
ncbi:type II toxin-antitoxin system HicB family antitoxin [Pseudomonas sp. ANT_J12]|nr:type II toxin-antitoxin system HicB family antitoxin [Pseudomonas sp. ANT_J12]